MFSKSPMRELEADATLDGSRYELSATNKAENAIGFRSRRQIRYPLQLSFARILIITVTTVALFLLIYSIYTNPNLVRLLWFEVVPDSWRFLCGVLTPKILFVLLNAIIISIFALGHLQAATEPTTTPPGAPLCRSEVSNNNYTEQDPSIRLNEPESSNLYEDGAANVFANDLLCLKPQYGTERQEMIREIKLQRTGSRGSNVQSSTRPNADNGENSTVHDVNLLSCERDISEIEIKPSEISCERAEVDSTRSVCEPSLLVRFIATETDERIQRQCSSRNFDEEIGEEVSHKDEEASRAINDTFIESLLSEKGSIFNQLQQSRQGNLRPEIAITAKEEPRAKEPRPHSPIRNSHRRGDTLEATWKAICERKRHSSPFKHHRDQGSPTNSRRMPNDGGLQHRRGPHTLRAKPEPSISQEELQARAEAYISRMNAQIKIQREKSLHDFLEMIGRGAR